MDGHQLNVIQQYFPEKSIALIDMNYHKDVSDALSARDFLQSKMMANRDAALSFLHDVYSLNVEEVDAS